MMEISMSQVRYIAALERQRGRIEAGVELKYYDDVTVGDKETHCSWGLCSTDKEAWPDPEDHLWPDQFIENGRVASKYRVKGQLCPFDTDKNLPSHMRSSGEPEGCFYRCRFFQARRIGPEPDRMRALQLYDERLEKVSASVDREAAQDGEQQCDH